MTFALPYEDRAVLTAARGALFAQLRDVPGVSITHLETNPDFTRSRTLFELERRFGEQPGRADRERRRAGAARLGRRAGRGRDDRLRGRPAARPRRPRGRDRGRRPRPRGGGPAAAPGLLPLPDPGGGPGGPARDPDADRCGADRAAARRGRPRRGRGPARLPADAGDGLARAASTGWSAGCAATGCAPPTRRTRRGSGTTGRRWRRSSACARPDRTGSCCARPGARRAGWPRPCSTGEGDVGQRGARARAARRRRAGGARWPSSPSWGCPTPPPTRSPRSPSSGSPIWRGPTRGRVRVISPYSARARRVGHMFVASLQDGDFPRRDTGGPLLSDEARAGLELPPRRKAEVEDRYLFGMLLSRPKRQLWLSWRSADDEGGAGARSPFVDDVRELLSPALPDGIEERDEALFEEAGGTGPGRLGLRARRRPDRRGAGALARGPPAGRRPARPRRGGADRRRRRADPRGSPPPQGAAPGAGAGADGRQGAVRALDAGEVRRVPLPLVRRSRARARADDPAGRRARRRLGRPPGAGAALPRAARPTRGRRPRRPWPPGSPAPAS